jgi:hypothetical protein
MGITIFASGKLDRKEDIPNLIGDLKRTAEENNWQYHVIDDDFDVQPNSVLTRRDSGLPVTAIEGSLGLKGIIVNVDPQAEPLAILFDRSGVLTDLMQQIAWMHDDGRSERFTMCKTQFGNIDAHIRIVELLDNLKKKYITDLTVNDEGAFWETRNRRTLAEKRVVLGYYLRHTEKVIKGVDMSGLEVQNPEAVASCIEAAILRAEKKDGSQH